MLKMLTYTKAHLLFIFCLFQCAHVIGSDIDSTKLTEFVNSPKTHEEVLAYIGDIRSDDNGLYTLKKMAFLYRKKGGGINEGICYDKIAWIFYIEENYSLSVLYLSKAKRIYERAKYHYGLGNINLALGLYELENKNYQLAEEHFLSAIGLFKKEQAKELRSDTLMIQSSLAIGYIHLGNLMIEISNYDRASTYFDQATKHTTVDYLLNDIQIGKITIDFNSGNKVSGIEAALKFAKTDIGKKFVYSTNFFLSKLHFESKNYEAALANLDSASVSDSNTIDLLQMYVKVYSALNKQTEALKYSKLLSDSEHKKYDEIQESTLELFKSHVKAEDYENKYHESENKVLKGEIRGRNLILVAIALIVLIITVLYFFRKRIFQLKLENFREKKSIDNLKYSTSRSLSQTKVGVSEIEKIIGEKSQFEEKVLSLRDQQLIKYKIKEIYSSSSAMDVDDLDLKHNLKLNFPNLTNQEVMLFYLLIIDKSAAFIADHFGIEYKSVYTKRHRLRKKIGIKKGENLVDFVRKALAKKE